MLIVDSHMDTPTQVVAFGRDLSQEGDSLTQVSFPKLLGGGIGAAFFALFVPNGKVGGEATDYAMRMLEESSAQIAAQHGRFVLARSAQEIRRNHAQGKVSVLFGMENSNPLDCSLELLRSFHSRGVSYVTLTHNGSNAVADSAVGLRIWGGLSPFGRTLVKEMNRLGVIVDTAHCSDEAFYDCLALSDSPIVSTHSSCRALCSHPRNMTDDMIRKMADKGGVIQINFYPAFLSDAFGENPEVRKCLEAIDEMQEGLEKGDPSQKDSFLSLYGSYLERLSRMPRPSVGDVVDHIEHAIDVGGIDHVGIGSDFDGIAVAPQGLEDISRMGALFDEMRSRGYGEDDMEKVAGGNFLRVMEEVQKVSDSLGKA